MEVATKTKTFYTHLMCSKTGQYYDKSQLQTFSEVHKPLLAQYQIDQSLSPKSLVGRPRNMWRYREMLPIEQDQHIITLGEGMTPLIPISGISSDIDLPSLWLKNEAFNPTQSFKARGLAMAISKAVELGVPSCVIPTAGNAGGAMSAYCAKAGMEAHVFMPKATPTTFQKECQIYGAHLTLIDGTIADCAKAIRQTGRKDWFDVSTLKEPFRLEGKKTMGYEIAEQMDWDIPDVVVYPTGGGTGLIGIWKAFDELEQLGWIGSKRPRMVAVQSAACYPIVRAFHKKQTIATPFMNPKETVANGLRVPSAFGDELILSILRKSNGTAIKIEEEQMISGIFEFAQQTGIQLSPEGAAVWEATKLLSNDHWIKPHETVVMLNTGSLMKYMENIANKKQV